MNIENSIATSYDLIRSLASASEAKFIESITKTETHLSIEKRLDTLLSELTRSNLTLLPSKELKRCKLQLTIIEGRLESLQKEAFSNCQAIQETVRALLRAFKQSNKQKTCFSTDISQDMTRTLNFDTAITKSLWTTPDQYSSTPNAGEKRACIFISENQLILSPKLQETLDDDMLEGLLNKSKNLFPQITVVTKFDFSKCPHLSPKIAMKIKTCLPNLDKESFSALSKRQFCDATLVVDGKQIAVNREFLAYHSPHFSALFSEKPTQTSFTLEGYKADELEDFIDYLIGKNGFSAKKMLSRLIHIMQVAQSFDAHDLYVQARIEFKNSLTSLAEDLENVRYEWLSELYKAVLTSIEELKNDISDLAYKKILSQVAGDEKWAKLNSEMQIISKFSDFPSLSDICERMEIEKLIPQSSTKQPYPVELAKFLETFSKGQSENKMALYLLGRIEAVSWQNKVADQGKAKEYFDQIPLTFAVEKNLLLWQQHESK
jgi:hypothetical protein